MIPFLSNLDMNQNEIKNLVIDKLASAPSSPITGQIYYNTGDNKYYGYNGTIWLDITGDLRSVTAGSTKLSVTSGGSGDATIDVTEANIVHQNLSGAGTNTHAQIDTHIADATKHRQINDAATGATDLWSANKIRSEIDTAKNDFDVKGSAKAATTAALSAYTYASNVLTASANGALPSQDGISITLNDYILVKNETGVNEKYNGKYQLTQAGDVSNPWKLTRAVDSDSDSEVTSGMYVFVNQGTSNANSAWVLTTNDPITLNTTALSFSQYSGLGQVTSGAGLTKTNNTLDVGAGNGIQVNADDVQVKADATGGANLAKAINVVANGVAVKVDGTTVGENGSGQLQIPTQGAGLSGGAGTTLSVAYGRLANQALQGTEATATPTADKIPLSNGSGKLDSWVTDADTTNKGKVELALASEAETKSSSVLALTPASVANFPIKKSATITGNGTATSFTVNHALGTRDVQVQVYKNNNTTLYETVSTDVERTDTGNVKILFASAPANLQEYRVIVIG